MFTNRKLYTLDPQAFESKNVIDQDKLIVNCIDIDFLTHIIFMPDFVFDSYELFDVKKVQNISSAIISEM
jgi:hypothetical protein